MSHKILVINPGSTSTKIGVFEDEKLLFDKTLRHSAEEIAQFPTIADQKDFRKKLVLEALAENHFDMKELSAVCGRGGLMKSIPGGTYQVTTSIVVDLVKGVQGQHASNPVSYTHLDAPRGAELVLDQLTQHSGTPPGTAHPRCSRAPDGSRRRWTGA